MKRKQNKNKVEREFETKQQVLVSDTKHKLTSDANKKGNQK